MGWFSESEEQKRKREEEERLVERAKDIEVYFIDNVPLKCKIVAPYVSGYSRSCDKKIHDLEQEAIFLMKKQAAEFGADCIIGAKMQHSVTADASPIYISFYVYGVPVKKI